MPQPKVREFNIRIALTSLFILVGFCGQCSTIIATIFISEHKGMKSSAECLFAGQGFCLLPKKRKRRKKTLALLGLILILWAAGVMILTGFNPFSIQQTTVTPVVVIIPAGSSLNVRLSFTPSLIKIVIGVNNTVIWKNEDSDWHTAHSNIPEFNSGLIPPGASFTHTFQRAGSFPYHCDPHPWMTGLVIVAGTNPIFTLGTAQLGVPMQIMVQFLVKTCDGTQV